MVKEQIIFEGKNRDDILTAGMHDALDYVYSISYPKPEKTFMEMCKDLNKEKELANGNDNWRKMYGKYQWPIDFFYLPKEVLQEVWESYKQANKVTNGWRQNLQYLLDFLFKEPGFKTVYTECTDELSGFPRHERSYEDLPLLKDAIGEDAANVVKDMIENYLWTYRYDSRDELIWAGAFLSTPTINRETVKQAWKEAFNKDITIPDDSAWVNVYDVEDPEEDEEV